MKYDPSKIEKKWQKYWELNKVYRADDSSSKPKYYQLETFPYPSAAGLHVGHPKGYIAEDITARYMRMRGREVMYTMGWDAFGLPTENYAIKVGKSPQEVATANIKNFKRQVRMFGLSYDWDREINTSDPAYYRWTQWLFIQLFNAGLAYQKLARVNWCPNDQTVLANEQVVDGACERCHTPVVQKEMKQWFLKITDYADRLLADLDGLDWPAATIKRQKDWVGKSEGLEEYWKVEGTDVGLATFTTWPHTTWGATFMVIAPEHPIITTLVRGTEYEKGAKAFIETCERAKIENRFGAVKEKEGFFIGRYAINHLTGWRMPLYIANFAIFEYGTGIVKCTPTHDQRDFEFAKKYDLPLQLIVRPENSDLTAEKMKEAYTGEGVMINAGKFTGMKSEGARKAIADFTVQKGSGKHVTHYKLRDWSVSRQRYWGVPIPIIHCSACGAVPVPDADLPVKLPKLKDYRPHGIPPLAGSKKFIRTACPKCGGKAERDAETLDTFVDSSWYFLRYADPHNAETFADPKKLNAWMPVKLYIIGAEHTVLHLLYSRFITKFLHDQQYLDYAEPFLKLRHVGLIQGSDGQKMSKSRGNVVNPDEIVSQFGADSVRLYEMFMGPFEDGQPWDTNGILGTHRFLHRVWKLFGETKAKHYGKTKNISVADPSDHRTLSAAVARAIKNIGRDIESQSFNTCVSELMKLLNSLEAAERAGTEIPVSIVGDVLKMLAPFAPHMVEEIWRTVLKNKTSIHLESWPEYDESLLVSEALDIPVQVNGRVRDVITVPSEASEEDLRRLAQASTKVKSFVAGKTVKKIIVVPGKLVNIVIAD